MLLENIAPKKFLRRYPLKLGAVFTGCFTLAIAIICVICLVVETMSYRQCTECTVLVMHNAYSFSINAIVYCIIMLFINSWFIWGAKREKSTVVLSWVAITTLWWAQSAVMVLILLCMYITNSSLGWIVALVSAVVAFIIFAYLIFVVYGYWLELKRSSQPSNP